MQVTIVVVKWFQSALSRAQTRYKRAQMQCEHIGCTLIARLPVRRDLRQNAPLDTQQ